MKGKNFFDFAAKGLKDRFLGDNSDPSESTYARDADTVIRNHVIWSMGAGLIPVLVADIFAVSALQLDMIKQLCRIYEVDFSETQSKAIISSLTSSTMARVGGSLVKLIPGVGSVLGGVTVSVFAGASTYALGEVFKKHFESGGTILDFDAQRLKKMYKEKFEKGKKVARQLRKEEEAKRKVTQSPVETASSANEKIDQTKDVITRLKELAELKEQGIISQEEFDAMKKKLFDEF